MSSETPLDDVELLESLEARPRALETFYRRHVAEVTRFLARRCQSPEDVADAVSTTFLAVIQSARTFDPSRGSPRDWLFSIARNEARSLGRSKGRRDRLGLRIRGSSLLSRDDSERLAELIDAERAVAQIAETLRAASIGERRLLRSMAVNDATVAEASRSLGISPSTGRKRLERLRGRVAGDPHQSKSIASAPHLPTSLEDV